MSTLTEIEEAADLLSEQEKEELLRHLALSLRKERTLPGPGRHYRSVAEALAANGAGEELRKGLTPEEFEAWWKKAAGVGVSGMTTDEHMALMRGEE